ncbi:hypothetical protein SAMN05421640_1471 [Ekhidna lutea]|uniref:Uncharacterized protein n=1 Tax=Ekhidna lutea TaxID=447679 RepID=A0A239HS43_EKHLU|nr:hypothetical protein [Ekhidna lutea]SNS84122.1 hypothetical protein SAMN05421640_1471 [Ekhidna lutea]
MKKIVYSFFVLFFCLACNEQGLEPEKTELETDLFNALTELSQSSWKLNIVNNDFNTSGRTTNEIPEVSELEGEISIEIVDDSIIPELRKIFEEYQPNFDFNTFLDSLEKNENGRIESCREIWTFQVYTYSDGSSFGVMWVCTDCSGSWQCAHYIQ